MSKYIEWHRILSIYVLVNHVKLLLNIAIVSLDNYNITKGSIRDMQ